MCCLDRQDHSMSEYMQFLSAKSSHNAQIMVIFFPEPIIDWWETRKILMSVGAKLNQEINQTTCTLTRYITT